MNEQEELITIKKASDIVDRPQSYINYLIKYDRIDQYDEDGNKRDDIFKVKNDARVSKKELENYIKNRKEKIKKIRKNHIGEYDERLAFDDLREKERTKHVHRLHPYKGKFIPQLVEFFLERNFEKDDLILDPFVGSGTTLVQANEMGMNAIGIDISPFNCLISRVKTYDYDINQLEKEIKDILKRLREFSNAYFDDKYQNELKELIKEFNHQFMPKLKKQSESTNDLKNKTEEKFQEFIKNNGKNLEYYNKYLAKQKSLAEFNVNDLDTDNEYLNKWFGKRSLKELLYYKSLIPDYECEGLLKVLLSRSARSVRLVPHYDLTNPDRPVNNPYFCYKHKKICTPVKKAIGKIKRYSNDTINRIKKYSEIKKDNEKTFSKVIQGDGRFVDLEPRLDGKKVDGVFTSPPYIGNINYHEQHQYAYELLDFDRYDKKEIGPKFKGRDKEAKQEYIKGISEVLVNIENVIKDEGVVFIVANDKYNLYEKIAKKAGMEIIKEYKRPVSKRAERDRNPYSEKIFKMVYV